MQLQIYIIFEKFWHKMSFKQRLKSSYTMTRFEFSWKMIPESRSRDRKRPITPGPSPDDDDDDDDNVFTFFLLK